MMARTESRVACRTSALGQRGAVGGGLVLDLLLDVLLDQAPIAVERRDQLAIGLDRPVAAPSRRRPRRSSCTSPASSARPSKKSRHSGSTDCRVLLVAGVELLDVGGVAAIEEGGEREAVVGLVSVVSSSLSGGVAAPPSPCSVSCSLNP